MAARDRILEADGPMTEEGSSGTVVAAGEHEHLRLDLLLPDTLPSHIALEAAERERARRLLEDILSALRLSDRHRAATTLKQLLSELADIENTPVTVVETGTPAKADHVDDFDTYFRVSRITAAQPGLSLVRGLLQTSSAVMELFARSNALKPERVEQQVDGFCVYARLLARAFDLEEPS